MGTDHVEGEGLVRRFTPARVSSAGTFHVAVVDKAGMLLTCGQDDAGGRDGILGHGEGVNKLPSPTAVPALYHVTIQSVSAGDAHTLALAESGAVYSFGVGLGGRLGHGDEATAREPKLVEALAASRASSISAGGSHSLVLLADGTVHSFGAGYSGALGHGDCNSQLLPRQIVLSGPVVASPQLNRRGERRWGEEGVAELHSARSIQACAVSAGTDHSLLLTLDTNQVFSCGSGSHGQLGHGSLLSELALRVIEALRVMPIRFRAIAAGCDFSLVLTQDARVYSFGAGSRGQLGHNTCRLPKQPLPREIEKLRGERVTAIAAGTDHSLVLTEAGAVLSFGAGDNGQLGHEVPEEMRGEGRSPQFTPDETLPREINALRGVPIKEIAAGDGISLAVEALVGDGMGRAFGWGCTRQGFLGHTPQELTPMERARVVKDVGMATAARQRPASRRSAPMTPRGAL